MDQAASSTANLESELDRLKVELACLTASNAELHQRDLHLRLAMQASNVVAYEWDIQKDRVTRLRSSSEPGRGLEDAGNFESVVSRVLPEDQAVFRADIAAALASASGTYRTELRYRRADGEIRWISESGRVIRGEDGRPARMVGITFDITDRKRAEESLRLAELRLRDEAQHKDQFLALLAHELRNPLAPIRNAVQVLRLADAAEGRTEWACSIIERQVGCLVRLVDDLLDVSRVASGKLGLLTERIDLCDVARHALDTSRSQLAARHHAVQLALPDGPVPIVGDHFRLTQVFTNLLNNAATYTDPGGQIELSVRREGTHVTASVRDNGRGLDRDAQARVFDRFYQADPEVGGRQGGLGLGLSLVKSLVELHGGSVGVESAGRGQGCVFSVHLPLADAPTGP